MIDVPQVSRAASRAAVASGPSNPPGARARGASATDGSLDRSSHAHTPPGPVHRLCPDHVAQLRVVRRRRRSAAPAGGWSLPEPPFPRPLADRQLPRVLRRAAASVAPCGSVCPPCCTWGAMSRAATGPRPHPVKAPTGARQRGICTGGTHVVQHVGALLPRLQGHKPHALLGSPVPDLGTASTTAPPTSWSARCRASTAALRRRGAPCCSAPGWASLRPASTRPLTS